ncbi:hypothetical protein [Marinospirillum insulare]|uniref:Exopolyphosphatase n=1 Tax=Marinospirillum insulare TaxID=217169 RepID=A0ABQ5ZWI9_9GAMM|nr:hypothetical protein [Marinospirillum insulare]GLR63372.1 exopolyphosphatase [Marinospirillum insulare]
MTNKPTNNLDTLAEGDLVASLDLGSNSFHLLLARKVKGELSVIKRMGEKVQLAAGLDANNRLSEAAQQRGLECLKLMAPFLQGLSESQVTLVATNTLRAAQNAQEFIVRAEEILGFPIQIIAGREEARLIYVGVVNSNPKIPERRLVIDIGGGSTEFIIGEGKDPLLLESLHMGCVSYANRYFTSPEISADDFHKAYLAAGGELLHIQRRFRNKGWQLAHGSSGSMKTLSLILGKGQFAPITLAGLKQLHRELLDTANTEQWLVYGIRPERVSLVPAGLAICLALFEALDITSMDYSDGALREGVLYELLGSGTEEDVRVRTVRSVSERFQIDSSQSHLVTTAALHAFDQVAYTWGLANPKWRNKLEWAANLHEIGLSVAHTQYHKHGAYLVGYADLAGFTRPQQQMLAVLIRCHRRKFSLAEFNHFSPEDQLKLQRLARLLRLAVLLHPSRPETPFLDFRISIDNSHSKEAMQITFAEGWLEEQPLLRNDLQAEANYLAEAGLELNFN